MVFKICRDLVEIISGTYRKFPGVCSPGVFFGFRRTGLEKNKNGRGHPPVSSPYPITAMEKCIAEKEHKKIRHFCRGICMSNVNFCFT